MEYMMSGIDRSVSVKSQFTFERGSALTQTVSCRSALLLRIKPLIFYPSASISSSKRDAASSIVNGAALSASA
jgi:hypothetical protein